MKDYSQPGDPYGISEYTAQSADTDVSNGPKRTKLAHVDERGCSLAVPRGIPTQEEADRIRFGG